jgi:hypothetical protein
MKKHERAAAFTGADGQAYSCAVYVEDQPDSGGRFEASLLFVRWNADGTAPAGHVETDVLARGHSKEEAEQRIGLLSLYDVKAALDAAIQSRVVDW